MGRYVERDWQYCLFIIIKNVDMRRFIIISMLLIGAIVECSAQEQIEALLSRDISSRNSVTFRMGVKRDPTTGEIVKRIKELSAIDDKELAREFKAAFIAARESADAWEEESNGSIYTVSVVCTNPKRIYHLTIGGSMLSVYAQTIYSKEK